MTPTQLEDKIMRDYKKLMNKRMEKKFVLSKTSLLGEIANWAVRQSPYHRPDNLEIVIDEFNQKITDIKFHSEMTYSEIKELLQKLKEIPEFTKWNERKNGNKNEYKFVSRYSNEEENPDDDFIDLDALIRNVANSIIREDFQKSIPEILEKRYIENGTNNNT